MKHVIYDISHSLLVNGWCRQLISSIHRLGMNGSGEILVTLFPSDAKTIVKNKNLRLASPSNGEKLIDVLSENNGLIVQSTHIKPGYTNKTKSLKAFVVISNYEVIKNVATIFADTLIEEQYGLDKQARLFKEILKEKYVEFENDELIVKWEYFSEEDKRHINILKTLFFLENEDYLDVIRFVFDLRVQRKVWTDEYNYTWQDTVFGISPMSLKIRIKQRLFTEWIKPEALRDLTVSFNKATGILTVANKAYDFCAPDSIEGDIMNLLVSNLNERVGHEKLALASWAFSNPENLTRKYKDLGKAEVNKKNKIRVNDLRKKIEKHKLSKLLEIVACRGYKLQYIPNLQLATSRSVELVAKGMPKEEDIPF